MESTLIFQARIAAPFGVLGIHCLQETLSNIVFLPPETPLLNPETPYTQEVCNQLHAYFRQADFPFKLALNLQGTLHQRKVWKSMQAIERGKTRQYGEIAREIDSSARAVGQACGANPVPIVIPCHRIVGKAGIGGFAHHSAGYELDIKRWLLAHEHK